MKGWQWLFLLEGLPAVILGFVVFARLHDTPAQARWLTPAEQRVLADVLDAEHRAADTHGQHASLWKEIFSPRVIRYALTYFFLVNTLAAIAIWTPLIVKGISHAGSSNVTVGLLAAIPQFVTIVIMVAVGHASDRFQERRWHLFWPMVAAAIGWFLTAYADGAAIKLAGVCLASAGSYTAMAIFWTTPDHAFSRRSRAIGIAVINAFGNISSALNPLVMGWLHDLTHNFSAGVMYSAILMAAAAVLALTLPISRRTLGHMSASAPVAPVVPVVADASQP
jgi:ACS family 4-hydroxyphenylacetate permease-like MFS transporter